MRKYKQTQPKCSFVLVMSGAGFESTEPGYDLLRRGLSTFCFTAFGRSQRRKVGNPYQIGLHLQVIIFFMVSIETVRQLALSFPETDEHPHFERKAFRVKKKIFATLSEKDMTVSLKLKLIDQSVFCAFDSSVIYPVPGGWGRMGFTFVNLKKVKKAMFKDALTVAYCTTAPPKLAEKFLPK